MAETDDLCEKYADLGIQLNVSEIEGAILIQSNSQGLQFLGELLIAHSKGGDRGFQISPKAAGKALFSDTATKGLYLDRVE